MLPTCSHGQWRQRPARVLANDKVRLVVLPGGGHIASLALQQGVGAQINPLWEVPWASIDPAAFTERDQARYGGAPAARLLASIMGHNLCFDFFGAPTPEEAVQGVSAHGEAAALQWEIVERPGLGPATSGLDCAVRLPHAQLAFRRAIRLTAGQSVVRFDCEAENLAAQPREIGWQEHVTLGPPFLEQGVTRFDASATWGQVYPGEFSEQQRLKAGAEFHWPLAPGQGGSPIDLRVFPGPEHCSDFSAQLMDPQLEWAWFTAVNPRLRVLCGYLWRRADFPWLGNWEEHLCRQGPPWNGVSVTRGMEFGASPFPISRQAMRELGQVHGTPTLRRLPGHGKWATRFYSFITPVPAQCEGVETVSFVQGRIGLRLRRTGETLELAAE